MEDRKDEKVVNAWVICLADVVGSRDSGVYQSGQSELLWTLAILRDSHQLAEFGWPS